MLLCFIKRASSSDTIQGKGLVGPQRVVCRRWFVYSLPFLPAFCSPMRSSPAPDASLPQLEKGDAPLPQPNLYQSVNPANCSLQHGWHVHPSLFLLRLDLGCSMKNNYIWSTKRWMLRRRELKRNDKKKKSAPIPLGYWSKKGALCQTDTWILYFNIWASGCWEGLAALMGSGSVWGVFSGLALRFGRGKNMRIQKMLICKCYRTRKNLGWFQRKM